MATPVASVKTTAPGNFSCIGQAETDVVVAVIGRVVVAIRHTAVARVVVPRPAAYDAVRAFALIPLSYLEHSICCF